MTALSERQQHILSFIDRFLAERSIPPSIRDIQQGCGISSTSVVDYNLRILEREGYLRRRAEISRGIELLSRQLSAAAVPVPLIGQIAAGEPIPVPEMLDIAAAEMMEVPRDMARGREGVYALRVRGTSMVDALINDGDIVVMQHVSAVDNGETAAVWLRAEKETTLKKVYVEPGRVRLQPANSQMQPIYAAPENVEIQGRVVGVIRQLS